MLDFNRIRRNFEEARLRIYDRLSLPYSVNDRRGIDELKPEKPVDPNAPVMYASGKIMSSIENFYKNNPDKLKDIASTDKCEETSPENSKPIRGLDWWGTTQEALDQNNLLDDGKKGAMEFGVVLKDDSGRLLGMYKGTEDVPKRENAISPDDITNLRIGLETMGFDEFLGEF